MILTFFLDHLALKYWEMHTLRRRVHGIKIKTLEDVHLTICAQRHLHVGDLVREH